MVVSADRRVFGRATFGELTPQLWRCPPHQPPVEASVNRQCRTDTGEARCFAIDAGASSSLSFRRPDCGVAPPATESKAVLADRLIFQTAYPVLGEWDQAEFWSPSEVLETVAREIAATYPRQARNPRPSSTGICEFATVLRCPQWKPRV